MASATAKNLKLLILGGGVLIGVVFYILYSYVFASRDNSQVRMGGVNPKANTTVSSSESENYKETLNVYNKQNSMDAEQKGNTYVSVLEDMREEPIKVLKKEIQQVKQEQPKVVAPVVIKPEKEVYPKVTVKKENKFLLEQTQALLSEWSTPTTHQVARTANDGELYVSSVTYKEKSNLMKNDKGDYSSDDLDKIVDAYALVPAVLLTELNSDENSLVKAYVPNGKYKGAYLFADGYKLIYESIDLTFNRMVYKGETYNVTAKPVDRETMRTTLSGDVNSRWFERVILPSIASAFGEAGNLYRDSNKTILQNGYSQVEATAGLPKAEAVAGVAIGGAASTASKVLVENSAKIPFKQVIIDKQTVIGVQFIGPVLKSDALNFKQTKDELKNSSDNNSLSNINRYQEKDMVPMPMPVKSNY